MNNRNTITKISFAPLQGYTEAIYRKAHNNYFGGIYNYYAPFVRYEKNNFRRKDIKDIDKEKNRDVELIPQLLTSKKEDAKKIIELFIANDYNKVDINLGCPFPLIAKQHAGAGILTYPNEVKELLSVVEEYPMIEFSVKMRLGWSSCEEWKALIEIINNTPLTHVTMHPRIGEQQYKGIPNMNAFDEFYNLCKHPIIYNGDITTTEEIEKIVEQYPMLAGVMIGRGLLMNPALAWEFQNNRQMDRKEYKSKLYAMHQEVFNYYTDALEGGEKQLLTKSKTFWDYLEMDHKQFKKELKKAQSLTKYKMAIKRWVLEEE